MPIFFYWNNCVQRNYCSCFIFAQEIVALKVKFKTGKSEIDLYSKDNNGRIQSYIQLCSTHLRLFVNIEFGVDLFCNTKIKTTRFANVRPKLKT